RHGQSPHRLASTGMIEMKATGKHSRPESTEDKIRIRHRRRIAGPIACRSRIGSGTLGSHLQSPPGIAVSKRSPARTNRVHVAVRTVDRKSTDDAFRMATDLAMDEAHISRRATHVERNEAIETGGAHHRLSTNDARGRSGEDRTHRLPRGGLGVHCPAV